MSYFDALAAGDHGAACEVLSDRIRTRLRERTGQQECDAGLREVFAQAPEEVVRALAGPKVMSTRADGRRVGVELRASGAYATGPKRVVVPMERGDGGWLIAELPADTTEDPVTTCFAGGMSSFEAREADPFWYREGRRDFAAYMVRLCKEIHRRGFSETNPPDSAELEAAAGKVLRAMIRSGRVEQP